MPTSHTGQINTIVELITTINPKSVLDIGIGHGKYGFLCREYLEAFPKMHHHEQRIRIDGIEGFPAYVTNLQKEIYDELYLGDARVIIDDLPGRYDLILMVDVFEHFNEIDGYEILSKCLKKATHVLISCPKNMDAQGAEHGNNYEIHQFQWKKSHFSSYECAFAPNYYSLICLLGPKSESVLNKWRKNNLKIRVGALFPGLRKLYLRLKKSDKRVV